MVVVDVVDVVLEVVVVVVVVPPMVVVVVPEEVPEYVDPSGPYLMLE